MRPKLDLSDELVHLCQKITPTYSTNKQRFIWFLIVNNMYKINSNETTVIDLQL